MRHHVYSNKPLRLKLLPTRPDVLLCAKHLLNKTTRHEHDLFQPTPMRTAALLPNVLNKTKCHDPPYSRPRYDTQSVAYTTKANAKNVMPA